jgi:hypothetical protein
MRDLRLRIIVRRCVRGFIGFCVLQDLTLHILRLRLEGDLFCRSFSHMSTTVILCLLVRVVEETRDSIKACLRYIHMRRRLDHVSHLESNVAGTLLVDNARIQFLSFLYKILHVRHPSYLFSLFYFASTARTRNLTVPLLRTLAMSQSFVVLGCRA